jgi:hypothetical protein
MSSQRATGSSGGKGARPPKISKHQEEEEAGDESGEEAQEQVTIQQREEMVAAREAKLAARLQAKALAKREQELAEEEAKLDEEEEFGEDGNDEEQTPGSGDDAPRTMSPLERVEVIKAARKVYELPILQFTELSRSDYLESWLFDWDKMAAQFELDEYSQDTTYRIITDLIDKPLTTWLTDKLKARSLTGKSGFSMKWFREQLKEEFVSKMNEDEVTEQAHAIKMNSNEDVEAFTQRAVALFQRVPDKRFPQSVKAEFLFSAVKKEDGCYPFLVAAITKEQSKRFKAEGVGMDLTKMRERLVVLANEEPKNDKLEARRRAALASKGQASSTTGKSILKNNSTKKTRFSSPTSSSQVNALSLEEGEDSNQDTALAQITQMLSRTIQEVTALKQSMTAMSTGPASKGVCLNWKKPGHWIKDCKQPRNPYCRICRKEGHWPKDCTETTKPEDKKSDHLKDQSRGGQ